MFGGAKPTFGSTSTATGFGDFTNTATTSPFAQSAFGKPATAAFGAAPAFGTQQTTPSLFGAAAGQTQQTGLFGGASTSSAFGATATTQPGFGGITQPQQNTSIFGAAQPAANTSSLFGQANASAFGAAVKPGALSGFGQTAIQPTSSLFGQPATATSTPGFSGFGQTAPTTSNVFGSNATSAFGPTSTAPAFGQTNTGFSGFGATAGQQQPSLFGQAGTADPNKTGFGLGGPAAGNTGCGAFNAAAATNVQGGGLFGAKPVTGFAAAPGFGATSQANTGFSNFNMNNTAAGGGGLFNSTLGKTATSGFGAFGTQQSTAPLNFNTGSAGTSLFSNTAAKPGGFFGNTLNTNASNTSGGFFALSAPNNPWRGIFNNTNYLGANESLDGGMAGTTQQQPIHQQILSKVTSPYGDNPIFKDLNRNDEIDAMRATNPMAQKALLESTSNNTSSPFRVSSKPSQSVIKVKPVGSTLTKKAIFEGLEEFDSTVESFTLKPNAKRLIIKPKPVNTALLGSGSPGASNTGSNVAGSDNNSGTLSRNLNSSSTASPAAVRNELCSTESSVEPPQVGGNADSNAAVNNDTVDNGRRESWLHPNN